VDLVEILDFVDDFDEKMVKTILQVKNNCFEQIL